VPTAEKRPLGGGLTIAAAARGDPNDSKESCRQRGDPHAGGESAPLPIGARSQLF
jgi:hypothetical protein